MFKWRKKINFWSRRKMTQDIAPDEIFLDSSNLPKFDTDQFEGRIEKPIPKSTIFYLGLGFLVVVLIFSGRIWNLQLTNGVKEVRTTTLDKLYNLLKEESSMTVIEWS